MHLAGPKLTHSVDSSLQVISRASIVDRLSLLYSVWEGYCSQCMCVSVLAHEVTLNGFFSTVDMFEFLNFTDSCHKR